MKNIANIKIEVIKMDNENVSIVEVKSSNKESKMESISSISFLRAVKFS